MLNYARITPAVSKIKWIWKKIKFFKKRSDYNSTIWFFNFCKISIK